MGIHLSCTIGAVQWIFQRAKGLGLGLAFEAEFESLPPTLSIIANASDGRLCCLLELRITLVRSLVQHEYGYKGSQNKVFSKTTYLRAFGRQELLCQGNPYFM